MKNIKLMLLTIFASTLLSATSSATIITDSVLFDADNPGLTVLDFEGIAPAGGISKPTPQPWAAEVLFTSNGTNDSIAISDSGFFFSTPSDALFVDTFDAELLGTFGTNVGSVGFDVAIGFGGLSATVEAFDGLGGLLDSFTFSTASETVFTTFIGFSDLGGIGSIRVMPANGGFVLIDNFRFGNSSEVPTPSTLAIFGLGLVFLGWTKRKKT